MQKIMSKIANNRNVTFVNDYGEATNYFTFAVLTTQVSTKKSLIEVKKRPIFSKIGTK